MYKENSVDPALVVYCYKCLAIMACSLALYYAAGFAYGSAKAGMTVFSHMAAVYMLMVTAADEWAAVELVMLSAAWGVMLLPFSLFVNNLKLDKK